MHLSFTPFLFGLATAASCPYAGAVKRSACPYADSAVSRSQPDEVSHVLPRAAPAPGKKGVFFMNRLGPSYAELFVANADGTDERSLLGNNTGFEYDPSWSSDGQWIIFTSERSGDGNPDVWRVRPDGSGLEEIAATSAVETGASISPNGSILAYQGTLNNLKSNIWLTDLTTGASWVSASSLSTFSHHCHYHRY
jgi:dipeptidyl aminopeptidase/acylaminoacyl peptidase